MVGAKRRSPKSSKIGVFAARPRRAAKKIYDFGGQKSIQKSSQNPYLRGVPSPPGGGVGQTKKEWDVRFTKKKEWTPYVNYTDSLKQYPKIDRLFERFTG